jgi:hypothetical protein
MNKLEIARKEAWQAAVWASALNAGVGVLGALAFRARPWLPMWAMVQFTAVGALTLIVLLAWRNAPRAACLVLFSFDVASALVASIGGAQAFVGAGQLGQLFESVRAGIIVLAIISPSVRLGVAWIGVFILAPFVQFYTWAPAIRDAVPPTDPWFIPIYGVVGTVLLLYRRRSVRLDHALSDARAERLTMERLARVSLALRDLANTPLQTLTTGVTLLRRKVEQPEEVLASMDRALVRLQGLRHALEPFEAHVHWEPQEESFDAIARIEQLAADLRRTPDR